MEESFDKPSFLIYKHYFNSISHFSNELLGLLFRTICEYQNDKKLPCRDKNVILFTSYVNHWQVFSSVFLLTLYST